MSSSIFILKKYTETFSDRIEEIVAASQDEDLLNELMVTLENKLPKIPEVLWQKFRRYALKRNPTIDENEYGIAQYVFEHVRHDYTLEDLKEAEDYYEGDFYKDVYIIEEIPVYNSKKEIECLTKF